MGWGDLQGQSAARRLLEAALTSGRTHHAYLFLGPDTRGKTDAARILAQALNCETGREEPCGLCRSCRLIAAGTHPDVRSIVPSGRYIRLEQVRELCRHAGDSPLLGRAKVYLLQEAEKLLPEAANHLLKTLEEPPAATVFILTAVQSSALLPTVLSRCQAVSFRALAPEDAARRLREEGCEPDLAHLAAHLAAGDPEEAAGWLSPEARRLREQFLELAPQLPAGKGAVFTAADVFAMDPGRALALLAAWYRDLTVWRSGARSLLYNRDVEELVARVSAAYSEEDLARSHRAVQQAERLILGRSNVNVRLTLEALLVELRAI